MNEERPINFLERLDTVTRALIEQPDDAGAAKVLMEALADILGENGLGSEAGRESQLYIDILANHVVWVAERSLSRAREQRLIEQKELSLQQMHQQLLKHNMALRERTMVDDLTGLFNRRYFERSLTYEIERFKRYDRAAGLVLFDIDHFKNINDTYGHLVGDIALRHLADLARGMIRSADILARYGGEEFTLLLPETGLDGARIMAERLREKVSGASFTAEGIEIKMTISCGVTAVADSFEGGIVDVIRTVDSALYVAKRQGRNRISVA